MPSDFTTLETHLRHLHSSAAVVPRILHIVIGVGFLGFFIKLYKPSEANTLFDGASLFLYMCGLTVYITNIVKGLRIVQDGRYGLDQDSPFGSILPGRGNGGNAGVGMGDQSQIDAIGREDSLKVLAASNTILALVLIGVLVLQAGQWYAERKDEQEMQRSTNRSSASTPSDVTHSQSGRKGSHAGASTKAEGGGGGTTGLSSSTSSLLSPPTPSTESQSLHGDGTTATAARSRQGSATGSASAGGGGGGGGGKKKQ